ncbi:flavodoxin reductase [Alphaproteobacteria bacterium GH1-50]|uniref:Flavodoxin reductase n=1 Tax=Kangsaoukella pontilimi TaxID=2691042 RepID=A0A7C9IG61_9RHOB|nr:flavodoxin reductase [Kangsaoukella pontilimi]MXQ08104.1 flavodoxin reductase [Kangsaoukella pontilimi]
MTHRLTLLETVPLTPDVKTYIFDKPDGYSFTPGQATEMALDRDGWRDEKRPFTFTSDPDAGILSFTIKSYPDHDGVTEKLPGLVPGDSVLIDDAWGAIEDKGPGVFIAGGAGITPFLGILRHRERHGSLKGCHLIFANRAPEDIILRPLWETLPDLKTTFVVAEGARDGLRKGQVDGSLLDDVVDDFSGRFYLCGPPPMEDAVAELLSERGVSEGNLIREE